MIYVKEQCGQNDIAHPFFLHTVPERPDDLPEARREVGFENLDFDFFLHGALFDGKCAASVPMPNYPVAAVRTGQRTQSGNALWTVRLSLNTEPYRTAYHDALADSPLAHSVFNVYAADGYLVYVKEQCGQSNVAHLFFLHVDPERTDDLPEARREVGFDNLDFDFFLRGALFDGKCAARIPLPDYPIAAIRTGQFGPGGELWSAEFSVRDAR